MLQYSWCVLGMKKVLLVLIITLAVSLRLYQLGKVPVSMSDDEIRETVSSYSLWQTGRSVTGESYPLSFFLDDYTFTPVPIYLSAPFVGVLGLNMFSARLPYALMGILTVIAVYLLVKRLLKKEMPAILSAFVLAISVWHLQMSRFAVETTFALFFYTIGVYFFLGIEEKKHQLRSISLAAISFFLAFHSYNATKIIYLPLLFILCIYEIRYLWRYRLTFATIIFSVLFTAGSFFYMAKTQNAARHGGQLFFFQDLKKAAWEVELKRRATKLPHTLSIIYYNKLTYWSDVFFHQYFYAFSPQYLFTDQEANRIYSVGGGRGSLYLVEAPLIILGLLGLSLLAKKQIWLILGALVISPLPSALSSGSPSYGMRSSFMLPWLAMLTASGICYLWTTIKPKLWRLIILIIIAIIYLYLFTGYLTYYYYDWALIGAKYYSKSTKDMIMKVQKESKTQNNILITSAPNTILHYAFYKQIPANLIQVSYLKQEFIDKNVRFVNSCLGITREDLRHLLLSNSLYLTSALCYPDIPPDEKISTDDGESIWHLFFANAKNK